ncbi:MAG: hypothetical protein WB523_01130 [Candidatus Sulfotelmatobacter sp.]
MIQLPRGDERQDVTWQGFATISIACRRGKTVHLDKPVTHVWSQRILFHWTVSRRKGLEAYFPKCRLPQRFRSQPIKTRFNLAAQLPDASYGPLDDTGELVRVSAFPTFPQTPLCILNGKPATVPA